LVTTHDLTIRRATPDDLPAMLALLRVSMNRADDSRFDELFCWKHLQSAFGASPAWLACDNDAVVGLRVLLRWEFEKNGGLTTAARAVDTVTHPSYQGRGVFTALTLRALDELAAEGVTFVFNTPNDQSRPGYLKMGWRELGRLPVSARLFSPAKAVAVARARVPASHWSETATFGDSAASFISSHRPEVEALIAAQPRALRYRTHVTAEFLVWRYAKPLLRYRAFVGRGGIEDGVVFARVRRRGRAREVVVAYVLVPGGSASKKRKLLHSLCRAARSEGDYALALARPPGFLPLVGQGPILTGRAVAGGLEPERAGLELSLGDIELF
jgi:GNAT superfamily N-acetyltransferase